MASRDETETTVVYDHGDKVYRVWTNYGPHVRKFTGLVESGRATLIESDDESVSVNVPASEYDAGRGVKTKRVMTEEQRRAASERMKALHRRP